VSGLFTARMAQRSWSRMSPSRIPQSLTDRVRGRCPGFPHENSDWSNGKLVIDANLGNIHLLQAAFYAVKLEVQRRKMACC
jgi:hypothetical protein